MRDGTREGTPVTKVRPGALRRQALGGVTGTEATGLVGGDFTRAIVLVNPVGVQSSIMTDIKVRLLVENE